MSYHDDDTCPHLVRASLLEAENARLKAEVARLYTEVMNLEENSMSNEYYAGENDKENARLKAEVERLRASSFVTAVPVEQYERLRKAGDAMADICDNSETPGSYFAVQAWNAAKEGKPSV